MSHTDEVQLPAICSKCLGDSTNLTLVRDLKGEPCRLCTQPFATFSWRKHKLGPKELSRFCLPCAERKNVCQSCYRNFSTGLPLSVHESASGLAANTAPQALKYAAVKAEVQAAAQASKQQYDNRITADSAPLAIESSGTDVVDEIKMILTQSSHGQFPEDREGSSTLLIANCDPQTDSQAIKTKLSQYGAINTIELYPLARVGFVTFSTSTGAKKAALDLPKGIFIVNQVKLRLLPSPRAIKIQNSEKQIAALIQQFIRGKLV